MFAERVMMYITCSWSIGMNYIFTIFQKLFRHGRSPASAEVSSPSHPLVGGTGFGGDEDATLSLRPR